MDDRDERERESGKSAQIAWPDDDDDDVKTKINKMQKIANIGYAVIETKRSIT